MECWNNGEITQYSIIPIFQLSSSDIPIFQFGKSPGFLCDKQVTKILPLKLKTSSVRRLHRVILSFGFKSPCKYDKRLTNHETRAKCFDSQLL